MKKLFFIVMLFYFSMCFVLSAGKDNTVNLSVLYLEDKRLPTISENDLKEIINEAKNEVMVKFGVKKINFKYKGKKSLDEFFNKYLKMDSLYYKESMKYRLKLFSDKIDYELVKNDVIYYLSQWKLGELKKYYNKEEQSQIKIYDDILPFLFDRYHQRVKVLEELKLNDGSYIINRKDNKFNSFLNWGVAMRYQKEYDVILCNTLIVYDDISRPYPPTVLRFAKIGGGTFESPYRPAFEGTSVMINLFEKLTDIDYFKSKHINKDLSKTIWNKITGRFIIAHEIGHMVYLIPDVSDHLKGCLMDSSLANMDYYDGYQCLMEYPEQCEKCQPYITARDHYFKADRLYDGGKYNEAADEYKIAAETTPEKLSINYNSYISLIWYKMARAYLKLNDKKMAELCLNKSIELDDGNVKTKNLLNIIINIK